MGIWGSRYVSVNNIKLISRINQDNMTIGCKLKDLVNIYTSEMYQDLVLKNRNFQNQGYIIVPKKYEFDKTFFFIRHFCAEVQDDLRSAGDLAVGRG